MHLIGYSFPALVIRAFQVFGLLQDVDLCDKFLRGQFVIVNAEGCREDAGLLFILNTLIMYDGFHI